MKRLRENGYDFGIIAARTIPDGVMGSSRTDNGLAVGHDYPEDFKRYREWTEGKVLITGPNTAQYVLPQHGTLGRDVVVAGRHAPADAPYTYPTLEDALWALERGAFGAEREAMVVGGPRMIRAACEMIGTWNYPYTGPTNVGKRALLLMTEFYDTGYPRRYPAERDIPTLADLPDEVHEFYREAQPNNVPGRPDFDFVSSRVY